MRSSFGRTAFGPLLFLLLSLLPLPTPCRESAPQLLSLPPFLGRPTSTSVTINLAAGEKDIVCYVAYKKEGLADSEPWQKSRELPIRAFAAVEIKLEPLAAGSTYLYRVYARSIEDRAFEKASENTFRTQRPAGASFSFALISDSHITPFNQDRFQIISRAASSILARKPDLFFMLGDNIQTFTSHGGPMTEERFGPQLYSLLRHGLGTLPSSVPTYMVNGNWEGENGWHSDRERGWARQARKAFIPNPGADTYPEGGSMDQDYYGFTWGDVLFLVLNVTGYTPLDHGLESPIGKADDWTLGEKQKKWLFEQLSRSKARWKFLLAHHTVGGKAGDEVNSRYGRGGGQAAKVGEQGVLHEWMMQFGVQAFFYGHDHVFTDIAVEGIHYVCVGSAGAPWKFPEAITGYKRYWPDSGYTWVDVSKDSVKVSFITPDSHQPEGKVLNTFELKAK